MKYDICKAFPYPVLRPCSDDFGEAEFQTSVDFILDSEAKKIVVNIQYDLSSEEIFDQIDKGNAQFTSLVCCRDTYFRQSISSSARKVSCEFDSGSFRGEVSVLSYVAVKKEIASFSSGDINLEFGMSEFMYPEGSILAQDETQVYYIDRELFTSITSVVDLVKQDSLPEVEWMLELYQDHIQVAVHPKMKKSIDFARNSKENKIILINSIFFSAVMQAIQSIKGSDEFDDYKWANVIKRQAHNMGLDLENDPAYVLAERLMRHPLSLLDTYVFKGEN